MRSAKGTQDFEEYEEEEEEAGHDPCREAASCPNFAPATSSGNSHPKGPTEGNGHSEGGTFFGVCDIRGIVLFEEFAADKNNDKASATRSKHSVTEQRRRSKINERFQILRDLIPHSDQKRDTASFLLEVIDYVRYFQGRVQKYEGSYQGCDSEPAKLIPWSNSHWHVNQPHAFNNGSGILSVFSGKLEENTAGAGMPPNILANMQNSLEMDTGGDPSSKSFVQQLDFSKQGMSTGLPVGVPSDDVITRPAQGLFPDPQDTDCCTPENFSGQQEDLIIEGGTINISSVYSQGLLNSLTNALQSSGLDLSHARISVQIDIGKRANRGLLTETSIAVHPDTTHPGNAAPAHLQHVCSVEELDPAQKRQKT
ncbi:hypothetical protein MLD38_011469 [Melastoma candidum]|uniref:Uncharacterized protein n=1 Tax=Melastoma candidum TaxID=119954 RepID=A0ACB9R362_9MYRT|nr:hypothetical protein MLD38_011469 [Melastoma candidum]